ncbi:MAG: bifunctional folylpolyglutamate synthase/dihydrofolate synthase, partial [Proteobacteria bacterium]|nr:bifunctional folylpolyglutamate synthase/dihydrofolate synthase [Pseudomonadota bacterium]
MRPWRVPYPKFGDGPGLERVAAVAKRLGIDLGAFGKSGAVIVGSNGKGSTAAMTAALLHQTRGSVGLFTSPHLFDLNERFNIDGEDISDDELERHWDRVGAAIDAEGLGSKVGGFEFLFLIAADWFAARQCAHTVWEAGIGGRLDPVSLIAAQRLALTSLDLEHTKLLGDTLEEIARDKIGAVPKGARLYAPKSILVRDTIVACCAERSVALAFVAPLVDAPLPGLHQRSNAALALCLASDIVEQQLGPPATRRHAAVLAGEDAGGPYLALDAETIAAGLANTHWPGRLEIIEDEPLIVIDVGHTPDAVRAALEGFNAMRDARKPTLVCGVSADKDAAALVRALAPAFETIICVAAAHKGAPAVQIAARAAAANPAAEIVLAESVAEARRLALARAKPAETAVYVAGALFLA